MTTEKFETANRWLAPFALSGLLCAAATSADDNRMVNAPVNRDAFDRPSSPNTWLIGPADGPPDPDTIAPAFSVSASRLAAAWQRLVAGQPRSRVTGVSEDKLQIEAEQVSRLFRFVDDISFRAVPIDQQRATFIAYSRSRVGYWDFGANRRRLEAWSAALDDALAETGQTQ